MEMYEDEGRKGRDGCCVFDWFAYVCRPTDRVHSCNLLDCVSCRDLPVIALIETSFKSLRKTKTCGSMKRSIKMQHRSCMYANPDTPTPKFGLYFSFTQSPSLPYLLPCVWPVFLAALWKSVPHGRNKLCLGICELARLGFPQSLLFDALLGGLLGLCVTLPLGFGCIRRTQIELVDESQPHGAGEQKGCG